MGADNEIYQVKRRHSAELLKLPGVSGVGVARGKSGGLVIMVHLNGDGPQAEQRLPKEIEGYPVETVQSGPFTKF